MKQPGIAVAGDVSGLVLATALPGARPQAVFRRRLATEAAVLGLYLAAGGS